MQRSVNSLLPTLAVLRREFRRNIGVTAVVYAQASDPIQKLFVDKLHDYTKKAKTAAGGLVDATPQTQKILAGELAKLKMQYGGSKEADMTKFPSFTFKDPELDPISMTDMKK